MTWAKFDDGTPDHPKVSRLSDAAHRLWFNGVCYATRMLTDGRVPREMVPRLYPKRTSAVVAELVGAGLWHEVDDGYDIHDYLTYQPSRADVIAKREAKAMAGAKGAASRWHQPSYDTVDAPVPVPVLKSTSSTARERFFRAFGHEGTDDQLSELESYIFTHPEPCVDWVFDQVAGSTRPGFPLARFLFKQCGALTSGIPHGPREKPKSSRPGKPSEGYDFSDFGPKAVQA